jgi:hypothetical protein
MVKVVGMVGVTRIVVQQVSKSLNYFIIARCIVAGDAQALNKNATSEYSSSK